MIKVELLKNLIVALKKIGVEENEINLEHPANPDYGDFATSIALKLAKRLKYGIQDDYVETDKLLDEVMRMLNKLVSSLEE